MSADDIFGPETEEERAEAEGHPLTLMLDPFGPTGRSQFICTGPDCPICAMQLEVDRTWAVEYGRRAEEQLLEEMRTK